MSVMKLSVIFLDNDTNYYSESMLTFKKIKVFFECMPKDKIYQENVISYKCILL